MVRWLYRAGSLDFLRTRKDDDALARRSLVRESCCFVREPVDFRRDIIRRTHTDYSNLISRCAVVAASVIT